jgi:hypothetical protein
MVAKKKSNCIPTKVVKRNPHGLIEDVDYIFNEDGFIDWRAMLKEKWLYPNPSKNLHTTDVSQLEDRDLCVLLGGFKELAQIRGYTNVKYFLSSPSSDYVLASCEITWVPNYETEGSEVVFSSVGDAGPHNTHGFGQSFLGPIAENRAFVRCVRNFLKINVVAQDEIAVNPTAPKPMQKVVGEASIDVSDPKALLAKLMSEKGITFDHIKKKLEKENYANSESFSTVNDIPNIKIFELLDRIQKIKKA